MQDLTVALHLGALETDNGQLIWSLRKDAAELLERGVMVRRPGLYRKAVAEVLERQSRGEVDDTARAALVAGIVREQPVSRLILSDPGYLGGPARMLAGGRLFRNAGRNAGHLRALFAGQDCAFFLGIRNPATLLPAVLGPQPEKARREALLGVDVSNLRWSEVVEDIRAHCPDCPLTVWSNEDTPVIWPRVLGSVAGLDDRFPFRGALDVARGIMSEAGGRRLQDYLSEHPDFQPHHREQAVALFLERFHSGAAVEQEIDLPEWSQALVDDITAVYLDDVGRIGRLPGVDFIA